MTGSPSLFARVWRRKLWFAGVALGSFATAATVLSLAPIHYVARGTVIVGEVEGLARAAEPVDIESQAALIRSPRLVRLILERPGVLDAVRQDCSRATPSVLRLAGLAPSCADGIDGVVDHVARQYLISPVGASRVVDIDYRAATPETAQGMANELVRIFLDQPKPTVAADRGKAVARLRQDVAMLESAMRDDESKLAAAHRAIAAQAAERQPAKTTGIATGIKTGITTGVTTGNTTAMAEAALRMKAFQRGIGGPPEVRVGLDARSIESVQAEFDTVNSRIAAEPAGSPMARSLRAHRDELRLRIGRDGIPAFRAANRAYLAAAEQAGPLQMVADIRPDVPTTPEIEPETVEHTLDLKRQLYVDAYRRASALEAEPLPSIPVNRLVNLAERPTEPQERRLPAWIGSLLASLALGTTAAVMRDRSDTTVRSAAMIERARPVAVLAQVPRVEVPGRKGPGGEAPLQEVLAAARENLLVQDALRGLLARLVIAGPPAGQRRTLLITSAAPSEGKSFTTLALAQLIATSGRRVLVVECDLRRPVFAAALNLGTGPGLGDVLRGFVPPREAVARTANHMLDAIPAGVPCIDSTELLMNGRVADLLAWATAYDTILLDTPPSDVLMDARLLEKLVDGVLVCTRWGRSKLADLGATVDGVQLVGGKVYGVAVTMVESRQHGLFDSRPVPARAYIADA